jgi:tRNA 2-thiouridine synthesizing protein A
MHESLNFLPNQVLDTSGLKCPLPVLKAKKALKSMAKGSYLKVIATDPGAMGDFGHFCEATGDVLLFAKEADGVLTFIIQKADTLGM